MTSATLYPTPHSPTRDAYWNRVWVAYLVLALGLGVSVGAWWYVQRTIDQRMHEQFISSARVTRNAVNQTMARYIDALLATRGFVEASDHIGRDDWRTYVNSIDLREHLPGVQGVGYAQRVEADQLAQHVAAVRRDMVGRPGPEYNVTPEQPRRDLYFPIVFLEPFDPRNQRAFGYDMFAEPIRHAAMERAMLTGQPSASRKVTLVQETQVDVQPGFLIYVPVYQRRMRHETEAERRAAITGFVYSPYRAYDLLRSMLQGRRDLSLIELRVFDGAAEPGNLFYDSRSDGEFSHPTLKTVETVTVAGRTWTLVFGPSAELLNEGEQHLPVLVLLGGTLFSWLLFGITWTQTRARIASDQAAERITRSEQALRASETRYRLEIEQSPIAIQTCAPDGATLYVNPAWERLWDLHLADLAGYNVLEDPVLEHLGIAKDVRKPFVSGEPVVVGPVYYEPPKLASGAVGRPRWVRTIVYPITDELGNVREVVLMHEDYTQRKESEVELQRAKEEAERANAAKDQFLAVLSHELRNPLAPVLAMVDVLERAWPELTPALKDKRRDIHDAVDVIRRNVELEARLIDDLLDMTRIARGKLHLERRVTDAHVALAHALEICQADVQAKGLRISLEKNAKAHHVPADPARLQQVFWNLVKNAVKFTPEGGSITIRTRNAPPAPEPSPAGPPSGDPAPRLSVEITDTGIGIAPDKLARVFEAFEQADPSITQRFGGLGLGLAISRALVEAHGGTIGVASPGVNQGSTFTVTLPTAVPVPEAQAPATNGLAAQTNGHPSLVRHGGRPTRILLVEDQPDARRALSMLLTRTGYDVRSADTAAAALATAADWDFDLLLSDVGLPDASGLDLVRQLKANRNVPAVALTGLGMEEDIRAAHEAGFAEHLTKPVQFDRLEAIIRRLVQR